VVTAPGKPPIATVMSMSASVEAIDAANRTLTLKGPKGNVRTLAVGPQVKNFDQIKVGDFVVVRYFEALTLELKKGGKELRALGERQGAVTAQPGEQPAAGTARQITVSPTWSP
jgi:hypothetical protein